MAEQECLRAIVRGHVQGVFFRRFVSDHAARLELAGQVRNLPDGVSVETVAQGDRAKLEELLRHLQKGPPGAFVHQVDVEWLPCQEQFTGFRVVG